MAVGIQDVALLMQLMEEEENDFDQVMMAVARVAVAEVMEMEEGVGLDELVGEQWVPITVNIQEYHLMGDPCFKLHFRMSRGVFEQLSNAVRNHLVLKGRLMRERRPFIDIMLMVIWLMATPDTFRSVSLRFGVRPQTLWYFYSYVIEALREMAPQFISWPCAAERQEIKEAFQRASGFPGIVGCIDCTHVYITAPVNNAANYINRHHSYSINVQAVVDNNLLVRDIHVGEVGSMNDRRVFRRSALYADILEDNNRLSPDEHLVGDGGYTLTDFMLTPFVNNGHLSAAQLNYNRRLSQSRVRVENAFGRAKGKWRRLKFLHVRNEGIVTDHILASFVLHNFLIRAGEPLFNEEELRRPIRDNEVLGNEVFEEVEDDAPENDRQVRLEELVNAAQERGIEKRLFITDHLFEVLHP